MRNLDSILRRAGILAAAIGVLACAAAAGASAAPLVFTGNYVGESVSVIDSQTNAPAAAPIGLGGKSSAIAIVPGGQALVASYEAETVTAIDTKTLKPIRTIQVGEGPEYIAVSPDGKTAYVTDTSGEEVSVINTATDAVTGSIPLGGAPYGIAFTPDGKFAYVAVDDTLEVIDTLTRKVVGAPIPVGEGAQTIAFTPGGNTAYVADEESEEVSIVDTALRQEVGSIPLAAGARPWGVAVSPDGSRLYVSSEVAKGTVTVVATQTNKPIGGPIAVGERPYEVALTPDGRTLYVADYGSSDITPIDTTTDTALAPIPIAGGPWQLAITPDQSPTASFTPPSATVAIPAILDGSASTDPDGTVASWSWGFGDGGTASGISTSHSYGAAGTYDAQLSVVDNEGCGEAEVFTGRTAYCSGNPLAKATHPVEVKVPPVVCSNKLRLGRMIHNRKNGTVRLQVRLPGAGSILLFGKKVHAVTRKVKKAGSMLLTIHARVELNKRLKKIHRTSVRVRLTFTPSAGCRPRTVHRSITLLRARKHKHRGARR